MNNLEVLQVVPTILINTIYLPDKKNNNNKSQVYRQHNSLLKEIWFAFGYFIIIYCTVSIIVSIGFLKVPSNLHICLHGLD